MKRILCFLLLFSTYFSSTCVTNFENQKLIDELGIEKSLYRRFATIEDISVNDVIYVDRNSKSKMKDSSVQSILMQAVSAPKTKSNNITEIKIDDFLNLIKSNVEKIEILPEN